MLPVPLMKLDDFRRTHPEVSVVSRDTGHQRNSLHSPYKGYFSTDRLMVPLKSFGGQLERKTLGIGVTIDQKLWFVPKTWLRDDWPFTLTTPARPVIIERTSAGLAVRSGREQAQTAQSFHYAWSVFYPDRIVVTAASIDNPATGADAPTPTSTRWEQ